VFAKTDLIHAQQAGFGRASICNGLCRGLAAIVVDTLFSGEPVVEPVVLAGGVARNVAVRKHLSELCGVGLRVDDTPQLYGALGAALSLATDAPRRERLLDATTLVTVERHEREYFFEPLELDALDYPAFESSERYLYQPEQVGRAGRVEVDIYPRVRPGASLDVFLGVDIGSTSTKAVLLSPARKVVAGFYTRTAGRPIEAVQAILETIWAWVSERSLTLNVRGAGTTGSGRSLVGSVLGADLVVDEISAHARAAYELDPETDTIIEIGGQDAKFTTLRNGMVTSAVMNTVCAAGTGTFIEEQARRLHCPLDEYPARVADARAPLASDRCTVFMQRDVSYLITHGYDVSEVLAAVLHSVRENYLMKVAREGAIGERICFQGATAKNRALVAAFAQRLGKRISVSQYCHLTGALGVGLLLAEAQPASSRFRGIELFRRDIPISTEVCDLCKNHCKITTAEVMGEVAAYGFLCGRDYAVDEYVSGNRSGFDLLKARRKILSATERAAPHG
jgi:predicted CoA-substrate-specific enzyme activase